jgi:hypothetical protein
MGRSCCFAIELLMSIKWMKKLIRTIICNILDTENGIPIVCPPLAYIKYKNGSKIKDQIYILETTEILSVESENFLFVIKGPFSS